MKNRCDAEQEVVNRKEELYGGDREVVKPRGGGAGREGRRPPSGGGKRQDHFRPGGAGVTSSDLRRGLERADVLWTHEGEVS